MSRHRDRTQQDGPMHHGHPDRVTCAKCGMKVWRENAEVRTVVNYEDFVCPDCARWDDIYNGTE